VERVAAAGAVRERLTGLDAVKGLAILSVVLIHAAPAGGGGYRDHVVDGVARLAVPVFLAVSGYLAGRTGWSRAKLAGYFWKFLRLHVTYGAFYWMLSILRDGLADRIGLKDVLRSFGAGGYPGQYYFAILVQTYFVAAFLLPRGFWRRTWSLPVSALAMIAGTVLLAAAFHSESPPALLALLARPRGNPVWLWFFYFALGAALGDRDAAGSPAGWLRSPSVALALVVAGVGIAAVGAPSLASAAFARDFPYSRLPIFVGATLVALALPALARLPAPRPLTRLGRESFAIFVFNPALLAGLAALLGPPASPWISWGRVAIAACGGLLIATVLRRRAPWLLA
jgi:peptidoglycan/LPS O-acetylase OafA/YrhL